MKVFVRHIPSLLLAFILFNSARGAAQDYVNFYPERGLDRTWEFSVHNANGGLKQINKITLTITTPGVTFDSGNISFGGPVSGTPANIHNWLTLPENTYTVLVDSMDPYNFNPISHGDSEYYFDFGLDTSALQKPIQIQWATWYFSSNGALTQDGSGFQTFFTRYDQILQTLDTATVTASVLPDCDPSFNLTIHDRNDFQSSIDGLRVVLVDAGGGNALSMRPSGVIAPPGWVVDSVTGNAAYFRAPNGGVQYHDGLGGFIVTAHSTPSITNYQLEWTAYNNTQPGTSSLFHIDYDTVAANVTPCQASLNPSTDTLVASKITGCVYNMILDNFHVSQANPTSRIKWLNLSTSSPGVSFASSPNSTQFWHVEIDTASQSQKLSFFTLDPTQWLPSGLSNFFSLVIDNQHPSTPFTLDWSTLDSAGTASSGSVTITCVPQPVGGDTVTAFTPVSPNSCLYTANVLNQHFPKPSSDRIVKFTIHQAGQAGSRFSAIPKPGSSMKWQSAFTDGSDTTLVFTAPDPSTYLQQYQFQTDTFTLAPANSNTPVTITYSVIDTAGNQTGFSTAQIQCTIPGPPCDTLKFTPSKTGCTDTISDVNHRPSPEGSIAQIVVIPQNGWKIDTFSNSINIPATPDTMHDSVIFSPRNPLSLSGMWVTYRKVTGDTLPIQVIVHTYNNTGTQRECTTIEYMTNPDCLTQQSVGVVGKPLETIGLTAYPNPSSGRTEIAFSLPQYEYAQLVLIDVMGRTVRTLSDATMDMGDHSIALYGSSLPIGTYYVRLETPYSRTTTKLVIEH